MPDDITEFKKIKTGSEDLYVGLCPSCDMIHLGYEDERIRLDLRLTDTETTRMIERLGELLKQRVERLKARGEVQ